MLRRWAVATVEEEPPHILGAHGSQCSTHRLDQVLLGTGAGLPEDVLYLREVLFYGVEIRRVRRQVGELAATLFDQLAYPFAFVGSKRLSITTT